MVRQLDAERRCSGCRHSRTSTRCGRQPDGQVPHPGSDGIQQSVVQSPNGVIAFEATDEKSAKHYKLDGKVKGTELIGTLGTNDTAGDIRLIKWTFFGR